MKINFDNQFSQVKPIYEYLKKQRENQKLIKTTELTATFLLISFFMYFAIKPTVLTISSLYGSIKSKQLLKKELKSKINDVIRAQDLYSQVQERYEILNSSLPDRPLFFDSANQIITNSHNSQIDINELTYSTSANNQNNIFINDKNLQSYSINLDVKSPFPSAINTISQLLQNRRLLNIGSISVNRQNIAGTTTPATNSNFINTSFTSDFYYWKDTNE